MKEILILGGHGDGLVAAQIINDIYKENKTITLKGFLNDAVSKGAKIDTIEVFGKTTDWNQMDTSILFVPALHKVKQMESRAKLIENFKIPKKRWATIIHPSAVIANDASIGYGTLIASHVTVQPGAKIGNFVTIRAGANIGHDAMIEDFSYVGPNATMCGKSVIEKGGHLSPNAIIADQKILGKFAVAGIGCAVLKDIGAFDIYIGNPCKKIGTVKR